MTTNLEDIFTVESKKIAEQVWQESQDTIKKSVINSIKYELNWRSKRYLREIIIQELDSLVRSYVQEQIKSTQDEIFKITAEAIEKIKEGMVKEILDQALGGFDHWKFKSKTTEIVKSIFKEKLNIEI